MAYVDVVIPDVEQNSKFFKFKAIGDAFEGWFVGTQSGPFGEEYIFRRKDGVDITITPSKHLRGGLERAKLERGFKVAMLKHGEKPAEKEGYKPLALFKLKVNPKPDPMPDAVVADAAPEEDPFA